MKDRYSPVPTNKRPAVNTTTCPFLIVIEPDALTEISDLVHSLAAEGQPVAQIAFMARASESLVRELLGQSSADPPTTSEPLVNTTK